MPRVVTAGSSQYLHTGTTAPGGVVGYPWSAALWFMPLALDATTRYFWFHGDSSEDNDEYWALRVVGTSDTIAFNTSAGASNESTTSTSTVTDNVWTHLGMIAASSTSRKLFFNGTAEGVESTADLTPGPAVDRWTFGCRFDTTADLFTSCRGYWPGIWNVELSALDMLLLSKGRDPRTMKRHALKFFHRFLFDEDRDMITQATLTAVNTPTVHNAPPFQAQALTRRSRARSRVA